MTYILWATALVAYFAAVTGTLAYAAMLSCDSPRRAIASAIAGAVLVIGGLAALMWWADADERIGPCVRYEHSVTAKGAPYRYCAERGEWVK